MLKAVHMYMYKNRRMMLKTVILVSVILKILFKLLALRVT